MSIRHQDAKLKEALFLVAFYGENSPTKGKKKESLLEAGLSETTAGTGYGERIIRKYEGMSFKESMKALGINMPYLAARIRTILDLPVGKNPKEVLAGARMALANFGEAVEPGSSTGGNQTFNGPTMVIVGASPEKMKRLTAGLPQMTEAERIAEEEAEGWKRLENLKKGRQLLAGRRFSKAKRLNAEKAAIPGIDERNDRGDPEARTEEGGSSLGSGAGDTEVFVDVPASGD